MKACSLWFILLAPVALPAVAECEGELLAEFRTTSPLKAAEPDSSFLVRVFDSGCFSAHRPFYDLHAGTRIGRMEADELAQFLGELESSRIMSIKPAALRQRLDAASQAKAKAKASTGTTLWRVADGNMVEFRFEDGRKSDASKQLQWRTLDDDLLKHPDNPELLGMKAAEALFMDLDRSVFEGEQLK